MFEIAFGKNRTDINWKTVNMEWPDFTKILQKVRRTNETMAEYDAMSKNDRDKIKNGKAFVGGVIEGGRRKKGHVKNRWLITLDADNADKNFISRTGSKLENLTYAIYSTHSCRPDKTKYRLVIPVDRAMLPDEYAAISRKIANDLGMHCFDKTTFDVQRLMYLPSCSRDAKPELIVNEGNLTKVDMILSRYIDWQDTTLWPRHPDGDKVLKTDLKKRGNPQDKPGFIGLFCQTYGMQTGVETFLPDMYTPTVYPDRWTYTGGTSFGGMRVYDDLWAYSEHQSDPANDGHCHNIFDLIRIHKFGHLDEAAKDDIASSKLPSYQAMLKFAANDPITKKARIYQDFTGAENTDWVTQLDVNPKTGLVVPTAKNIEIILTNGDFQDLLAYNVMANAEVISGDLPWRKKESQTEKYEPWLPSDDNCLRHYLNKQYGLKARELVLDTFVEITHRNKFHPIKEYIESFTWDETPRVEQVIIDYLGADNTRYVRTLTRKMLVAAIKRIYEPGCKYDYMLVLIGPQGAGKSSLLAKLGGEWFTDSLKNFDNKEAGEQLRKSWFCEVSELAALRKAEIEDIKQFISRTSDKYRVPYERIVSTFPRQCIICGTTNDYNFLRDTTGNRRFWPIEVDPKKRILNLWTDLTDAIVGQIWAEAKLLYHLDGNLELDERTRKEAEDKQNQHMEEDPRETLIRNWLDAPIENFTKSAEPEYLQRVCATQIALECLGVPSKDLNKGGLAKDICNMMRRMPAWEELKDLTVPGYGQQHRLFERIEDDILT